MVVIRPKKEQVERAYRAECKCECVFDFRDSELKRAPVFSFIRYIKCPECGRTLGPLSYYDIDEDDYGMSSSYDSDDLEEDI